MDSGRASVTWRGGKETQPPLTLHILCDSALSPGAQKDSQRVYSVSTLPGSTGPRAAPPALARSARLHACAVRTPLHTFQFRLAGSVESPAPVATPPDQYLI